jgi:hypothetical protein
MNEPILAVGRYRHYINRYHGGYHRDNVMNKITFSAF